MTAVAVSGLVLVLVTRSSSPKRSCRFSLDGAHACSNKVQDLPLNLTDLIHSIAKGYHHITRAKDLLALSPAVSVKPAEPASQLQSVDSLLVVTHGGAPELLCCEA